MTTVDQILTRGLGVCTSRACLCLITGVDRNRRHCRIIAAGDRCSLLRCQASNHAHSVWHPQFSYPLQHGAFDGNSIWWFLKVRAQSFSPNNVLKRYIAFSARLCRVQPLDVHHAYRPCAPSPVALSGLRRRNSISVIGMEK
jgi:hypothetical protein